MKTITRAIYVLIATIILQVLFFRFGVFSDGRAIIFFHIYGLILLPVNWHKTSYLIICTGVGVVLDLILVTGGLHMLAGAATGMVLPACTRIISPRDGFSKEHKINVIQDGWARFLTLCFLITSTYTLVLFIAEGARWNLIPGALFKTILSTLLNVTLFALAQGIFGPKAGDKKSKIGSYT